MSKEQVERSEREMFENFLDKIYDEYKLSELSYFERNLEVNCSFPDQYKDFAEGKTFIRVDLGGGMCTPLR